MIGTRFISPVLGLVFVFQFFSAFAQKEEITLKTKTGNIYGTLRVPAGSKGGIPVVLIIAGSGPTDRNGNSPGTENNSLKYLAESLDSNGIATLCFDKRGIAESRSAMSGESDLRFGDYVDDVRSWINLLSKDKRFGKLIVAGHSEGSQIGVIASADNKKVAALISIAGPGRPADLIIKEQLAMAPEDVRSNIYDIIDSLKAEKKIASVPPALYAFFRPSVQPYMISWFKSDPAADISKLSIPVLIIHGTTDVQVKRVDAEMLLAARPGAQLAVIENMNHVLKHCETDNKSEQRKFYTDPGYPIKREMIKACVDFIASVTR